MLVTQDIWSCQSCCSCSSSTWWSPTGEWWCFRCLIGWCTNTKYSVEAKYFCAVALNCRPSYLNFLLRLRQSCPDEPLKHRNIGKIPQKSSHISQFFELWNGIKLLMNGWMLTWMFLFQVLTVRFLLIWTDFWFRGVYLSKPKTI